ncbi:polyketide biosynthesis enoyl-CoA hydratase PksH [Alteromonadaceae bacterium 2753L.S.0a.02]|nr:polyketide biosynthesis enoyl-CoA hydratase PksH [Alteromonadaceae bacterium 2753L.S.0a.02]
MDILVTESRYSTLKVRQNDGVCTIQLNRPDANNTINDQMVSEFIEALDDCDTDTKIVVVEGLPDIFCFGADFQSLHQSFKASNNVIASDPEPMYDLWQRLASGPFISIAHVRGQANAGGIGFVAACDIVISDANSIFSLSELLFGLMPACVLPFLIRKMGFAKAHYMTVTTEAINAQVAKEWGLVDEVSDNTQIALRKKLLRLNRLSKQSITRYKRYMSSLNEDLQNAKCRALAANTEIFSDTHTISKISRYVETGQFPWE